MVWPALAIDDLWRWIMITSGALAIAYGLFKKQMQLRNGTFIRRPVPELLARCWLVLIGICSIALALKENP